MKVIWDKKAKNFPRYNKDNEEDRPIFEYFNNSGIKIKDKNLLDLGCGNGRYAIHFAQEARIVYALDISSNMLLNVSEDAKSHNIHNIKTFCSDWEDFNVSNFEDSIDIVFASLTPALNNFSKFKKAYNLAREAIFYIGWGRKRESEFLDEIFKAHNAKVELPVGANDIAFYLSKLGKKAPEIYFITKDIHHKKSLQDSMNDVIWQLEVHQITPNYDLVREIASSWAKNDIVCYSSIMEIGLMVIKK